MERGKARGNKREAGEEDKLNWIDEDQEEKGKGMKRESAQGRAVIAGVTFCTMKSFLSA